MQEDDRNIITYTSKDGKVKVATLAKDGKIRINLQQKAEIFTTSKPNNSMHIRS